MSNITPAPSEFLSFLYTLNGLDSGNNYEVDKELSFFVFGLLQPKVEKNQGKPITQVFELDGNS